VSRTDKKWVDALRQYLGDGTGEIPVYEAAGQVDADRTMENFMAYFNIKKATPNVEKEK
jgi:hypothetical protein